MQNLENLGVFEILITQKLLKCLKDPFLRSALICMSIKALDKRLSQPLSGILLRVRNRKIFFLFLNQNMLWVHKRTNINETVLLSTQYICSKLWVRKYLQFYTEIFCLSKPVHYNNLFLNRNV